VLRSAVGDVDVFSDKPVQIFETPGRTPGHHSLMLKLKYAGTVILSGDVAHFENNDGRGLVPRDNVNRADTLASIGRVRGLAAHYRARVVILHAANVFEVMPKLPAYLD
jgi:N-acyl homoserine lactone hydrolase